MNLFWVLSILFLLFAFGVLLWTFVWVARLLAVRSQQRALELAEPPEDEPVEEAEEADPPPEEEAAGELASAKKGVGVNATLGLILAGLWFSANALWIGLQRFALHFGYQTGQFTILT